MKKIGVIGIGNPLRRDDGIGIVLLEKIQKIKTSFDDSIEYIDGGTGGMNLLHLLPNFECIVFIDAVYFGGKPGESKLFTIQDVISEKKLVTLSTHGSDFFQILQLSKQLHELPDTIVFFGVQPKDTSFGHHISTELKQKIDVLIQDLQKEIQSLDTKINHNINKHQ